MGIKVSNLEQYFVAGVVGDGTEKTLTHGMNTVPTAVILTSKSFGVDPVHVSSGQNTLIVKGALGTFDVLVIR